MLVPDGSRPLQGNGAAYDTNFQPPLICRTSSQVGSTRIEYWPRGPYPDFVAEGTSDQHVLNAAICAVKKATYDGVDCVGGDDAATGTVCSVSCGGIAWGTHNRHGMVPAPSPSTPLVVSVARIQLPELSPNTDSRWALMGGTEKLQRPAAVCARFREK